jgi:autoinducer 2-degrading protein
MYIVVVTVHVKPEHREAFIAASRLNSRGSRTEPGNLRWDLLAAEDDPNRFLLHEVYRAKDDFAKHQQTPHYLTWKTAVADMMAQPRVGLKFTNVEPDDAGF